MMEVLLIVLLIVSIYCNECPDGVELVGSSRICRDEVGSFAEGVFICTVTDEVNINWNVNGTTLPTFETDDPGRIVTRLDGDAISCLVERTIINQVDLSGNRTSVLHYSPDSNINGSITIACDGDGNTCSKNVIVYGMDGIDTPFNMLESRDENAITHTWDHLTTGLVSHYLITVEAPGLIDQVFQVNTRQIRIPLISGLEYAYSGSVIAVSVCGHQSNPLTFTGSTGSNDQTTTPTTCAITTTDKDCNCSGNGWAIFFGIMTGILAPIVVGLLVYICLSRSCCQKKPVVAVKTQLSGAPPSGAPPSGAQPPDDEKV